MVASSLGDAARRVVDNGRSDAVQTPASSVGNPQTPACMRHVHDRTSDVITVIVMRLDCGSDGKTQKGVVLKIFLYKKQKRGGSHSFGTYHQCRHIFSFKYADASIVLIF